MSVDTDTIEQIVDLRRVLGAVSAPEDRHRLSGVIRQMRHGLAVGVPKHRAAALLGVTPQALERWIAEGRIPTLHKPGSTRALVERDAFIALLAEVRELREAGDRRPMAKAIRHLEERGELKGRLRPNQSARELRFDFERTTPQDRLRIAVALSKTAHVMAARGRVRQERTR